MAGSAAPFVGDPGPQFEPSEAEAQPGATVHELHAVAPGFDPQKVRSVLTAQGQMTHDAIGVSEDDWLWRRSELDSISEPMAAILNKYPMGRAIGAVSDELTVGAVMFSYSARSIKDRLIYERRKKAAQQAAGPRPVTGVDGAGRRVPTGEEPIEGVDWRTEGA